MIEADNSTQLAHRVLLRVEKVVALLLLGLGCGLGLDHALLQPLLVEGKPSQAVAITGKHLLTTLVQNTKRAEATATTACHNKGSPQVQACQELWGDGSGADETLRTLTLSAKASSSCSSSCARVESLANSNMTQSTTINNQG